MDNRFPSLDESDRMARPAKMLELYGFNCTDNDADELESKTQDVFFAGQEPLVAQRIRAYAKSNGGLSPMAKGLGYGANTGLLQKHLDRGSFGPRRARVIARLRQNYSGKIALPTEDEARLEGFFQAVNIVQQVLNKKTRKGKPALELTYDRLGILAYCCQEADWIRAVQANKAGTEDTGRRLEGEFLKIQQAIPQELARAGIGTPEQLEALTLDWRPSLDFCRIVVFYEQ